MSKWTTYYPVNQLEWPFPEPTMVTIPPVWIKNQRWLRRMGLPGSPSIAIDKLPGSSAALRTSLCAFRTTLTRCRAKCVALKLGHLEMSQKSGSDPNLWPFQRMCSKSWRYPSSKSIRIETYGDLRIPKFRTLEAVGDVPIWGFPKIVASPNHVFEWGFPFLSTIYFGIPPF